MLLQTIILALASVASATQPGLLFSRASFPGVATFNDYAAQSSTVCGPKAGMNLSKYFTITVETLDNHKPLAPGDQQLEDKFCGARERTQK